LIKQIAKVTIFTITITYLALHFQWLEFYKGYSYSENNFLLSMIFLLAWVLFSFYWGIIQEKKYLKFISIYWGCLVRLFVSVAIIYFNKRAKNVHFKQWSLFIKKHLKIIKEDE